MNIYDMLAQIEQRGVCWPWMDSAAESQKNLVAVARAVLDLHKPVYVGPFAVECNECPDPKFSNCGAEWPCPTVRAVESAMGVAA